LADKTDDGTPLSQDASTLEEPSSEPGDGDDTEPNLPIPEEVLAGVPAEHRQAIVRAFSSVTQLAAPVVNPVLHRITSEHVSQIIDNTENGSVREHDASRSRRRYQFAYFLLGAGVTVGLIVFFTVSDNRELIPPIVTAIAGFLGGLATGQYFRR
jgi:hypothetical protein